jgi:hypothetical protein
MKTITLEELWRRAKAWGAEQGKEVTYSHVEGVAPL